MEEWRAMRKGNTGMAMSELSPCEINEAYLARESSETSNSRKAMARK